MAEHTYTVETRGWDPGNPDATATITFRCPVKRCMSADIQVSPTEGVPALVGVLVQAHATVTREAGDG